MLLADLACMRKSTFSAERDDIIATWGKKGALPWGDQDVLNVYLNRHRDQAYVLPCKFNVRWAHLCSPDELRLDFLWGRRFLQGRRPWECQLLRYDVIFFCTEDLRPMPYPSGPHLMAQARPECHCDQAFSLLAVLHSL